MTSRFHFHAFDAIARRIGFRQGIVFTVIALVVMILVSLVALVVTENVADSNQHLGSGILSLAETTEDIRTSVFLWEDQVVSLQRPGATAAQKHDAQSAAEALFAAIQKELEWYADHPDDGADYLAQLQTIATKFEQLQEMEQRLSTDYLHGRTNSDRQLSTDTFHATYELNLVIAGLAQQQLFGVQEHGENTLDQTDRVLTVSIVVVLLVGLLMLMLIALVQRATYLRLDSCMSILDSWAHGSLTPRVTDPALLKNTPENRGAKFTEHYPFAALAHFINQLGDVLQVFLLEMQASLEAMASGNIERRINHDGFPWQLKKIATDINANIDHVTEVYMKADQEQTNLDGFQRDLGIISMSLGTIADQVGMRGMELLDASVIMESRVESTGQEADRVQQSMAQASSAVDAISQSITEVAMHVREASGITTQAVAQAQQTQATIADLSQASGKIGSMVELITSIARQTQMLSMNATIEAARAGEAGRGFAVVASEVKQLAEQTSHAAKEISASIEEIQQSTESATQVIQEVAATIGRINAITTDIEQRAAEQERAARGIAGNVNQANHSSNEMLSDLGEVREASNKTHSDAETMNKTAQELRQSIDELDEVVKSYIGEAESDEIELF
ncbi:MAG: methyl-accepting chemotaxis protein [Mariprofundales bacterium]|nr:methyl-accepting chemotaxis protein [Mariprofundales bacterium]